MIPVKKIEIMRINVVLKGGKKFQISVGSSKFEGYMIIKIKIKTKDNVIPEKKNTIHESLTFIFY